MPVFLEENMQGLIQMGQFKWASLYIAVLIIMSLGLAINVGARRLPRQIGLGDGGDPEMIPYIRVHGNFLENAPLAMIALIMLSVIDAPLWTIHIVGLTMIIGRALHAYGIGKTAGISFGRGAGMGLTMISLIASALFLVWFGWR